MTGSVLDPAAPAHEAESFRAAGPSPRRAARPLRFGVTALGADGERSGIGQYVIQILRAMAEIEGGKGAEVVAHDSEADLFAPEPLGLGRVRVSDRFRAPLANVAWHQLALPGLCRRRGWDAVFLPAANRRLPAHVPCPSVGTVHDFSMLHVAGKYDRLRGGYIGHVLPRLTRRLTRVITVSESSRRDVVRHGGVPEDRVHVIPHGVDHARFRPGDRASAAATAARYGVRGPYVVYVSRLEHPGKNHVGLVHAFERLHALGRPHQLLIAGADWSGAEAVHRAIEASPARAAIVRAGFVRAEDLPDLYRAARLMVFPSLYEGFGMPLLEAMACGTPVACSDTSSLPEVAGDAAAFFDPASADSIADAMDRVLRQPALSSDLVSRGLRRAADFTWRRAAEDTLEVIRRAAGERR